MKTYIVALVTTAGTVEVTLRARSIAAAKRAAQASITGTTVVLWAMVA